jgi:outer membrane protein OmpA-like peptidoglycan-associated protein
MRRCLVFLSVALLSVALAAIWSPAHAQFGFIGDKLKEKAQEKTEDAIDKAADGSEDAEEAPAEAAEGEAQATAAGGTATAEGMQLYTKYDFIPGDRVIFYDDLSSEELGEFPSRWRLDQGVFEIANQGGKNYIMCTDEGGIRPRIGVGPLPPKYTIEMEFYVKSLEAQSHWFFIKWYDADDAEIGNFAVRDHDRTNLRLGNDDLASKALPVLLGPGLHTMRIMATQTTMKCYVDNERVANVPATEGFQPTDIGVWMDPWLDEPNNPMLIGTFRYAEGGKTLKQQLDETGRIVSHGILFDSGSAKIKAESYKTLADIAKLLTDDPALKLSIEGHTDSDGTDEANLTLSQSRANAVRTYFIDTYKIDGGRLTAKGWGEGKPIDVNTTPEGKANNRRVEFVKV